MLLHFQVVDALEFLLCEYRKSLSRVQLDSTPFALSIRETYDVFQTVYWTAGPLQCQATLGFKEIYAHLKTLSAAQWWDNDGGFLFPEVHGKIQLLMFALIRYMAPFYANPPCVNSHHFVDQKDKRVYVDLSRFGALHALMCCGDVTRAGAKQYTPDFEVRSLLVSALSSWSLEGFRVFAYEAFAEKSAW